jgi:hypothetical protein
MTSSNLPHHTTPIFTSSSFQVAINITCLITTTCPKLLSIASFFTLFKLPRFPHCYFSSSSSSSSSSSREEMGTLARRSSYGYSKLDKEDPEEVMHRRAQFLIYKALQQADFPRRRPSLLRLRLCRLKIKIGKKLKKLRKGMLLSISAARVRVYEQVTGQWKRLFGDGEAIASLPPMLALNA